MNEENKVVASNWLIKFFWASCFLLVGGCLWGAHELMKQKPLSITFYVALLIVSITAMYLGYGLLGRTLARAKQGNSNVDRS